jgi:hypothetical protein
MSDQYNITAEQGSDLSFVLTYRTAAAALVNLTGYTAKMQVRKNASASAAYISLTETSGITLGGAAGTVTLLIDSATLQGVQPGSYVYDLILNSNTGLEQKLITGTFDIAGAISR